MFYIVAAVVPDCVPGPDHRGSWPKFN